MGSLNYLVEYHVHEFGENSSPWPCRIIIDQMPERESLIPTILLGNCHFFTRLARVTSCTAPKLSLLKLLSRIDVRSFFSRAAILQLVTHFNPLNTCTITYILFAVRELLHSD